MNRFQSVSAFGAVMLLAGPLSGCAGGSSAGASSIPPPPPSSTGSLSMNLYPSANDGTRLFVMVTAVGSLSVDAPTGMPLAFDTGSAGLTLYAPDIFPAAMVSAAGFVFPEAQDTLSYNGITVTKLAGVRKYGGTSGRTQAGNLGFATITFGDNAGTLTTRSMPVLFYYAITDNLTGASVAVPTQRGWFGVNDAPNSIVVSGSVESAGGYPVCDANAATTCWVVSILKYLTYTGGAHAGFLLSPAPLQNCFIATPGSCVPAPMLRVGLTDAMTSGYSSEALVCPPAANPYSGPVSIENYPVCQSLIPNAMVAASTAPATTLSGYAVFDSGTPDMVFNLPPGSVFPAVDPDAMLQVTVPSGFVYQYTPSGASSASEAAPYNTVVNLGEPGSALQMILGVGYFTTHAFFIDYTGGQEGWK